MTKIKTQINQTLTQEDIARAFDWVATDPCDAAEDVKRLGLDGAVEYNMDLAEGAVDGGDDRWTGVRSDAMRIALSALKV